MLEELPLNPEYLDPDGNLRPFSLIDLRNIHVHQEKHFRASFVEMVEHLFYSDRQYKSEMSA